MPDQNDQLSDAELEAALEQAANNPQPAPEPEPEPEPETMPEPEAAQEPEPEPASEPEAEIDDTAIIKAQLAEMEARAKHWEQVAGRNAGKLGWLERKLGEVETRSAQVQPRADDSPYDEPTPSQPTKPQTYSEDKVKSWIVGQAIRQGAQEFMADHPDLKEMDSEIQAYLSSIGYNPQQILTTDDPTQAYSEIKSVLNEAYSHVRVVKEAARRKELETKRAEQLSKRTEMKTKAAVSASGSAPPPKPKPKSIQEMTDAELEAQMIKETGGRW